MRDDLHVNRVILDTNVFVSTAFNPQSASARIIEAVRGGALAMIWNMATRLETQTVLTRIPPVSWDEVADLFLNQHRCDSNIDLLAVQFVSDPEDRKFAALAQATGAMLVSSDKHLLEHRSLLDVCTPTEFLARVDTKQPSP